MRLDSFLHKTALSAVVAAQAGTDITVFERSALALGWRVSRVDCQAASDKLSLLDCFAAQLGFPAYFGRNWDAFIDCLTDLGEDDPKAAGYLVIIAGTDVLFGSDKALAADLLDSVKSAAALNKARAGAPELRFLFLLNQPLQFSFPQVC